MGGRRDENERRTKRGAGEDAWSLENMKLAKRAAGSGVGGRVQVQDPVNCASAIKRSREESKDGGFFITLAFLIIFPIYYIFVILFIAFMN